MKMFITIKPAATRSDARRDRMLNERVLEICRHAHLSRPDCIKDLEVVRQKAVADLQRVMGVTA